MLRMILAAVWVMTLATGAHAKRLPKMTNSVGMTLVKIPAGSFMMGDHSCKEAPKMCPDPFDKTKWVPCKDDSKVLKCDGETNERPLHKVTLTKPLWVMTTEVTQRQFYEVMGGNPSHFTSDKLGYRSENNPVETVSWYDAVSFANKLSDKEELSRCYSGSGDEILWDKSCKGYRMPTEAEWEYVARARQSTKYAGSDNIEEVGWYDRNSEQKTHPVGQKKANAWGLYDMSGNVCEWTWDWLAFDLSERESVDPTGPNSNPYSSRVVRGGDWVHWFNSQRVARRVMYSSDTRKYNIGIRLVRTAQ